MAMRIVELWARVCRACVCTLIYFVNVIVFFVFFSVFPRVGHYRA